MVINEGDIISQAQAIEKELSSVMDAAKGTNALAWFYDDFALRFCWSSNAIEGSTLSLDETVALIEYDEVRSGHTFAEYRDAKNLYQAIKTLLFPNGLSDISEEWIKKVNSVIMGVQGDYRQVPVKIGNLLETVYVPPNAESVPELMKAFAQKLNFEAQDLASVVKQAAKLHFDFERIHPFTDGNGRTGRMLLNQQLINHGLLPISLNKTGAYRRSFKIYGRNGDTSLLAHEILNEEAASISRLRDFCEKIGDII